MEFTFGLIQLLLVSCLSVTYLEAQTSECSTLNSLNNLLYLHNVTLGLSNVQELQQNVIQPMLRTRVPGTKGNLAVRNFIKSWMSTVGWSVEEDSFEAQTPYGQKRFSNIIATLHPGRSRRVIIACHYDSKYFPNIRFVGAVDSAVPCALLLDSASRLQNILGASHFSDSALTLQFIFFDGEEAFLDWTQEDSLYGSRHLAAKWEMTPDPNILGQSYLQTIDIFILLDLIGMPTTSFKQIFQETSQTYLKLQNIESCLQTLGYLNPTQFQQQLFTRRTGYRIEDDHVPFLERQIPILHLISYPFPAEWHTPQDDLPALEMALIDNLARILRVYIVNLPL